MTMTEPVPEVVEQEAAPTGAISLKDKVAARRRQLEQTNTITLPIPGYEDLLAARYKPLGFEPTMKIVERNEKLGTADQVVANAADSLVVACEEILEIVGEDDNGPIYQSTGHKWTTNGVREIFDVDLPDGTTARDAILAAMPGPAGVGDAMNLTLHYAAYTNAMGANNDTFRKALQGESAPSPEGS